MNEWSESLGEKGLRLAYHPHGYEFRPEAGGTAFDVLLKESNSKTVVFEVDTFWAEVAGQNCAQLIARLGSRVRLLHLKDLRKERRRECSRARQRTKTVLRWATA